MNLVARDCSHLIITRRGWLPFSKHDLTLRLAEQGYGTLYTGGGAEYDVSISLFSRFYPSDVYSQLRLRALCIRPYTEQARLD
jgi:hypothetical protein